MKLFSATILIVVTFFAGMLWSQDPHGIPPNATESQNSVDTVDVGTLAIQLSIPLHQRSGRIPLALSLSYSNNFWVSPYLLGNGAGMQPPPSYLGWGQIGLLGGDVNWTNIGGECSDPDNPDQWYYYSLYYVSSYKDPNGNNHSVGQTVRPQDPPGCAEVLQYSSSIDYQTNDGSGYMVHFDGGLNSSGPSWTVYAPNGDVYTPGQITDRNGNRINVTGINGSAQFNDTLGNTAAPITWSETTSNFWPVTDTISYKAPNGATRNVVITYQSVMAKSNFGCALEVGPIQRVVVSSIAYPDGTQYSFTYEPTYGYPSYTTGRIASVHTPSGATISYAYSGSNHGYTCVDGIPPTMTRTTPDGVWTYNHTPISGSTPAKTTVTDPQGNQTVYTFTSAQDLAGNISAFETERDVKDNAGTLLETDYTCYNGQTAPCNISSFFLPINRKTTWRQLPNSSGKVSKVDEFYNSNGLLTERDEYDFGSGTPPATATRKTITAYANLGNIKDRPSSVTVEDGGGNIKIQTTYAYDQSSVIATSGTPGHVAVTGSRGNPTTITYLTQGSGNLSRHYTYFDTGNVSTSDDVNGTQSRQTFTYGACGNTFLTNVSMPYGLSTSQTWNCDGGVLSSTTDENGKTATTTYTDPYFWRPYSSTDPLLNSTTYTYTTNSKESVLSVGQGIGVVDTLTTLDSLGRPFLTQQRQGGGSTSFDTTETDFDSLGRQRRVTLPFTASAGQGNASAAATVNTYDPLDRIVTGSDSSGLSTSYSYPQNDIYVSIGPAPTGENPKRLQYELDGLGRLASVCEITSGPGSGTCGQSSPQTGFWTKYSYDVQDNLTAVTQNAQSGTTQSRSYLFDGMGRLISEINPETGISTYIYDSVNDSAYGCVVSYPGDLVEKIDANGNHICYDSDLLHRVTRIRYFGTNAANTPEKHFVFDNATVNNIVMSNTAGRLARAYTGTLPNPLTDIGISYTARGETSDIYEMTPNSAGYNHTSSQYWENGAQRQLTAPGVPTINYVLDGMGRPYSASATSGQNPITSTTYKVGGLPQTSVYGSGDADSFQYDPMNRMSQYVVTMNTASVTGNLTWNSNGSLGQQQVIDTIYSANSHTCTYSHDDLQRISSVNCGCSVWQQSFAYDSFGNLSKSVPGQCVGLSFSGSYSSTNNRLTNMLSAYDNNGNVTGINLGTAHTYSWDAEGHLVNNDGVQVIFDALDRPVEQQHGSFTQIVYGADGRKLSLMSGASLVKSFVPLPGGGTAVYGASGLMFYRHADYLGSARIGTTATRTLSSDVAYAPFGEPYNEFGPLGVDRAFTGQNQDIIPGLSDGAQYDFLHRQYSLTQGRWLSPDPSGRNAADPWNPQSWNLYAYVKNNPLSFKDIDGLDAGEPCEHDALADGGNGCDFEPPSALPEIDPCQGRGENCYRMEIAETVRENATALAGIMAKNPACKAALKKAGADASGLARAFSFFPQFVAAGLGPGLLGGFGLRESNMSPIVGDYGHGHGYFQFDDRYNSKSVLAIANDIGKSSQEIASRVKTSFFKNQARGFSAPMSLAGAIREYNAGGGGEKGRTTQLMRTGRMANLDLGTAYAGHRDYVSNVLSLATECF